MGKIADRSHLEDLMRRMTVGDVDALFELLLHYHSSLAKLVCGILHSLGRGEVARRRAEVDFLVQGAGLVLFERASGWSRDGALPWVWAHHPIRAEIVSWLGHPSVEFDPQFHVVKRCDTVVGRRIDLHELAGRHQAIAEWIDAVDEVANERDQKVHLEYQTQKHLGDRSPAQTVSAMFGLSAANVRQIDRRVRRRLADRSHGPELTVVV